MYYNMTVERNADSDGVVAHWSTSLTMFTAYVANSSRNGGGWNVEWRLVDEEVTVGRLMDLKRCWRWITVSECLWYCLHLAVVRRSSSALVYVPDPVVRRRRNFKGNVEAAYSFPLSEERIITRNVLALMVSLTTAESFCVQSCSFNSCCNLLDFYKVALCGLQFLSMSDDLLFCTLLYKGNGLHSLCMPLRLLFTLVHHLTQSHSSAERVKTESFAMHLLKSF
uniref:Transmembrane protein n=1 Tax=Echinococcus granulosus TaxID=6210 RepID=A0A068WI38_ECHGR|nr:hypothetical protein EgrG_000473300 [Echinococcus granulosus]